MRTEIDPTLTTLNRDLSKDWVAIHFWKQKNGKGKVCVGGACDGSRARLLLKIDADSPRILIEIERDEYDDHDPEWIGTITEHIPLEDVFDIEVYSVEDDPSICVPPFQPYARWLRNRSGQWRRLDLS